MNPTIIQFFVRLLPYAIAASVGFGAAFYIQGLRITDEKQKHVAYVQEQEQARIDAEKAAEEQRKETANEWRAKLELLAKDHDAYKRCVAAGKCGGLRPVSCSPSLRIPASGGIDGSGTDPVSASGESSPEVINDCAKTQLMLNQLQDDIEKQRKRVTSADER